MSGKVTETSSSHILSSQRAQRYHHSSVSWHLSKVDLIILCFAASKMLGFSISTVTVRPFRRRAVVRSKEVLHRFSRHTSRAYKKSSMRRVASSDVDSIAIFDGTPFYKNTQSTMDHWWTVKLSERSCKIKQTRMKELKMLLTFWWGYNERFLSAFTQKHQLSANNKKPLLMI